MLIPEVGVREEREGKQRREKGAREGGREGERDRDG